MSTPQISSENLYMQVVQVTNEYLGPASERFITRQVENHLHKSPQQLQKKDIDELVVWLTLSMNLLIDEPNIVEKYIASLKTLTVSKAA